MILKTKSIIEDLKISTNNIGNVTLKDKNPFIIMDNILHTFPNKIPLGYIQQKYYIYDSFIIYYEFENIHSEIYRFKIKNKNFALIIKIPEKMVLLKNNVTKNLTINIEYDEFLKIYFILILTNEHHYKIYDFQETEYEIYEDKEYFNSYSYIEGTQYMKKSKYKLNNIYNLQANQIF